MMPELDGRGFLRECRADPRLSELNVIMVTAASATSLEGLNVDAVFTKPFNLTELVDTVISIAPA
jgi:DNA-binding response OmpR family regulator